MNAGFGVPRKKINEDAGVKKWHGEISDKDDFGDSITDTFIDGRTQMGPWAIMSLNSWTKYGVGSLGTGNGQKYKKDSNGEWIKIEG